MKDWAVNRTDPNLFTCKVDGVPLLVSRSWLVALGLTAFACSAAIDALIPELPLSIVVVMGGGLAIALSISLVIHELAHALVARSAGIAVDHIRLFAGGALCRRLHDIEAPREQFVVAAAGPLASTALAVSALGLAVGGAPLGLTPVFATALWLLAFVNILIAVVNLLPVFPFDGSKLVHSLLWRAGRDQRLALVRLERGGREFSRVVAVLGFLLMAFGGEQLIGLTVLLLGVYLLRLPPSS